MTASSGQQGAGTVLGAAQYGFTPSGAYDKNVLRQRPYSIKLAFKLLLPEAVRPEVETAPLRLNKVQYPAEVCFTQRELETLLQPSYNQNQQSALQRGAQSDYSCVTAHPTLPVFAAGSNKGNS